MLPFWTKSRVVHFSFLAAFNIVAWIIPWVDGTAKVLMWILWSILGTGWLITLFPLLRPRKLPMWEPIPEADWTPPNDGKTPIIGFRFWYRGEFTSTSGPGSKLNHRELGSVTGYVWKPGEQTAECSCSKNRKRVASMKEFHSCGFYAHRSLNQVAEDDENGVFVWGVVAGWGRVTIHEDGWRAEKAKILALIDPELMLPSKEIEKTAALYGVPVIKVSQLKAFLSEWGVSGENSNYREGTG